MIVGSIKKIVEILNAWLVTNEKEIQLIQKKLECYHLDWKHFSIRFESRFILMCSTK